MAKNLSLESHCSSFKILAVLVYVKLLKDKTWGVGDGGGGAWEK